MYPIFKPRKRRQQLARSEAEKEAKEAAAAALSLKKMFVYDAAAGTLDRVHELPGYAGVLGGP